MKRVDFISIQMVREKTMNYEVTCASDGVSILRGMGVHNSPEEKFFVLCLNAKGRVTSISEVSHGGQSSAPVEMSAIFSRALLSGAKSIIVSHNHPSGDPTPSDCDRILTERIVNAGKIMGIPVLDHLVIGYDNYYSFAGEGLI